MKHTWKIGESCKGGVITVEINGKTIDVIGKEWDMSKGTLKSSDQSNAKEFTRLTVSANDSDAHSQLDNFLNDLTTSYYSDIVIEWIKSNCPLNKSSYF